MGGRARSAPRSMRRASSSNARTGASRWKNTWPDNSERVSAASAASSGSANSVRVRVPYAAAQSSDVVSSVTQVRSPSTSMAATAPVSARLAATARSSTLPRSQAVPSAPGGSSPYPPAKERVTATADVHGRSLTTTS